MTAWYNEIDPYAAQWLRNLIAAGHIAPGVVDERSIEDVRPNELAGYTQCHFFAGLGGWAYALDLAGWPRDRPVWTGSCPCQPFSAAGKGAGFADERHLWPAWQHLIAQCRPAVVFGEQVASKAVDPWIDLVHADLEGMGYAFGCVPFPAAGIGAPHIRDRTYWVADADHAGLEGRGFSDERAAERPAGSGGMAGRLAYATPSGRREECADAGRRVVGDRAQGIASGLVHGSGAGWLADLHGAGRTSWREGFEAVGHGPSAGTDCGDHAHGPAGQTNGQWGAADWLACTDGKWRPVEPGSQPLAHGIPGRVGRLRAYGNAIVAPQAAEFVRSYDEVRGATVNHLEQARA